jgi:hypothetical protein
MAPKPSTQATPAVPSSPQRPNPFEDTRTLRSSSSKPAAPVPAAVQPEANLAPVKPPARKKAKKGESSPPAEPPAVPAAGPPAVPPCPLVQQQEAKPAPSLETFMEMYDALKGQHDFTSIFVPNGYVATARYTIPHLFNFIMFILALAVRSDEPSRSSATPAKAPKATKAKAAKVPAQPKVKKTKAPAK